jgi:hypothetical protein
MPTLVDTQDMFSIHEAFRRAWRDGPDQIASIGEGDAERATRYTSYFAEVTWMLDIHHEGEDELLHPLLVKRIPESEELFSRMEASMRWPSRDSSGGDRRSGLCSPQVRRRTGVD